MENFKSFLLFWVAVIGFDQLDGIILQLVCDTNFYSFSSQCVMCV